jgi:AAHS family 4-hydroxybenzoate transporter-like MFS transporter
MAKFGAMLGPWLAGFVMDQGVDARGTFFVFAFFPVAMVVLLVALGRVQRGLPADADGALHVPAPAVVVR